MLWLLAFNGVAMGQQAANHASTGKGSRYYIGLDVSRNLYNFVYPGLHAEVLGKYNSFEKTDRFTYTAAIGYSKMRVSKDTLYHNLVGYFTKGWYAKAGFELGDAIPNRIKATFGTQFIFSRYQEGGDFWFEDGYFGDARVPFLRRDRWAAGLETVLNTYFPAHERLSFNLQLRVAAIVASNRSSYSSDIPPFYTPGFGLSGNGVLSGGVSLQAFYLLAK